MRSRTFGYTILKKMHEAATKLSEEHDPKKIQKLKKLLDGFYAVWEKSAERRKERRPEDCEHKRTKDYFCTKCGAAVK